jgi:hypothetical protein
MDGVVPVLVVITCLAAVMGVFTWLARLVRRRGLAGTALRAAMAAYEAGWHVSGYEAHQELRVQAGRRESTPAPHELL